MSKREIHELAGRLLGKPFDQLDEEERRVLALIAARRPNIAGAILPQDDDSKLGARLADRVATAGGSWSFIIGFLIVLVGWMLLNTDVLARLGMAFDPYPYIFLNLMLSMLAAVQAPIILMSQNRQSERDRKAAALDYEINLRAEIELLRLQSKIDAEVVAKLDEVARLQRDLLALHEARGRP